MGGDGLWLEGAQRPGGMDPAAGLEDGRKGLGFISLEVSPSQPSGTFGVCASGLWCGPGTLVQNVQSVHSCLRQQSLPTMHTASSVWGASLHRGRAPAHFPGVPILVFLCGVGLLLLSLTCLNRTPHLPGLWKHRYQSGKYTRVPRDLKSFFPNRWIQGYQFFCKTALTTCHKF